MQSRVRAAGGRSRVLCETASDRTVEEEVVGVITAYCGRKRDCQIIIREAEHGDKRPEDRSDLRSCGSSVADLLLSSLLLNSAEMCDQKSSNLGDDEDELSVSDDSEPEERPCMASFDPILDHSDEDDEEEVVRAPVGLGDQSQFSLKGGGTAFSNRSHSIFDCLDSLAKPPSSSSSSSVNQQRDGVFARPQAPPPSRKTSQPPLSPPNPPKRRGTPDYLVHPERWTHYSLEDVSETSDQGNTRAALSFLSTLKERKEEVKHEEEDELTGRDSSSSDLQKKMIFSKPSRLRREQPAARSKEKEMLLSHLQDEDEEGKEALKAGGRRPEVEETQTEDHKEEERQREKGEGSTVFTSFRKMNSKNYRRSSAKEEH